jgi:transcriptional regulator with XRE-family HTH domain
MPRPNGRDPEADPAAYLGKQLKKARMAAGYASQDALAAALGFERSTITKAESGARPPTNEVFKKWCEVCGITEEVREVLEWFKDRLELEAQAHAILAWQPMIVPGLLQTGGGSCVEVGTAWRKASYSSNGGDSCVEAGNAADGVLVRDTTDRDGAALSIPSGAWKRFTAALQ